MGYRGLLLNAPYKIDSMVWMRCGLCCSFVRLSLSLFLSLLWAIRTRAKMGSERPKIGVIRVLRGM
jgi:hypothetical protein